MRHTVGGWTREGRNWRSGQAVAACAGRFRVTKVIGGPQGEVVQPSRAR